MASLKAWIAQKQRAVGDSSTQPSNSSIGSESGETLEITSKNNASHIHTPNKILKIFQKLAPKTDSGLAETAHDTNNALDSHQQKQYIEAIKLILKIIDDSVNGQTIKVERVEAVKASPHLDSTSNEKNNGWYRWFRASSDGEFTEVYHTKNSTYSPTIDDVGSRIFVQFLAADGTPSAFAEYADVQLPEISRVAHEMLNTELISFNLAEAQLLQIKNSILTVSNSHGDIIFNADLYGAIDLEVTLENYDTHSFRIRNEIKLFYGSATSNRDRNLIVYLIRYLASKIKVADRTPAVPILKIDSTAHNEFHDKLASEDSKNDALIPNLNPIMIDTSTDGELLRYSEIKISTPHNVSDPHSFDINMMNASKEPVFSLNSDDMLDVSPALRQNADFMTDHSTLAANCSNTPKLDQADCCTNPMNLDENILFESNFGPASTNFHSIATPLVAHATHSSLSSSLDSTTRSDTQYHDLFCAVKIFMSVEDSLILAVHISPTTSQPHLLLLSQLSVNYDGTVAFSLFRQCNGVEPLRSNESTFISADSGHFSPNVCSPFVQLSTAGALPDSLNSSFTVSSQLLPQSADQKIATLDNSASSQCFMPSDYAVSNDKNLLLLNPATISTQSLDSSPHALPYTASLPSALCNHTSDLYLHGSSSKQLFQRINDVQDEKQLLTQEFHRVLDDHRKDQQSWQHRIEAAAQEIKRLQKQCETLHTEREELCVLLKDARDDHDALRNTIHTLSDQTSVLANNEVRLASELRHVKDARNLAASEKAELQKQHENCQQQLSQAVNALTQSREEVEGLRDELLQVQTELQALKKSSDSREHAFRRIQTSEQQLRQQLNEAREEIKAKSHLMQRVDELEMDNHRLRRQLEVGCGLKIVGPDAVVPFNRDAFGHGNTPLSITPLHSFITEPIVRVLFVVESNGNVRCQIDCRPYDTLTTPESTTLSKLHDTDIHKMNLGQTPSRASTVAPKASVHQHSDKHENSAVKDRITFGKTSMPLDFGEDDYDGAMDADVESWIEQNRQLQVQLRSLQDDVFKKDQSLQRMQKHQQSLETRLIDLTSKLEAQSVEMEDALANRAYYKNKCTSLSHQVEKLLKEHANMQQQLENLSSLQKNAHSMVPATKLDAVQRLLKETNDALGFYKQAFEEQHQKLRELQHTNAILSRTSQIRVLPGLTGQSSISTKQAEDLKAVVQSMSDVIANQKQTNLLLTQRLAYFEQRFGHMINKDEIPSGN